MYSCVSLNRKNFNYLLQLDDNRQQFNFLNECFHEYYSDISWTNLFLLYKKVKLLKNNDKIEGYIWISKYDRYSYIINSMYVNSESDLLEKYAKMLQAIKSKAPLIYDCERNHFNYELLKSLGFKKFEGTYEMTATVPKLDEIVQYDNIAFEPIQKGKHENVRCDIQNQVFKNDSRVPLTKEDIYYDEVQHYYFDKGSILVRKGDNYIGYGQIIINDNMPTIVNVGILEEYRGKGYGRVLMRYLLKICNEYGFEKVNLRVSANNNTALKLYKSLGFDISNEIHRWEYKK